MRGFVAQGLLCRCQGLPRLSVFKIEQLGLRFVEPRLKRRNFLALNIQHVAQILDLLLLMRKHHLHFFYRLCVHEA